MEGIYRRGNVKSFFNNDPTLRATGRFRYIDIDIDESRNGYHMNNVGGVTYTQHKFGFAADMGFSNTTKSMDVSSALGIPNGGFFTFSFWIKMNTEITTGIQYFVV